MSVLLTIFAVGLGGAIGAILRYFVNHNVHRVFGFGWPYGTFGVNIIGSLLMGVFMGWFLKQNQSVNSEYLRLFFAIGMMGALTTFSTFSMDIYFLFQKNALLDIFLYISLSIICSIGALFFGLYLMR